MAEYSQAGILTALLLFTVVTVRDIYLGRSAVEQQPEHQQQQAAAESSGPGGFLNPDPLTQRQSKAKFYTGPLLKFQYCKVFQEYSRSISQLYPDIRIEGENYPPKPLNKYAANFISYFKLLAIALVVTGQNPFQMLGMETPRIWSWGQENKIFSCLMAFFLSNMLETHFLSTGAFEITLNDVPIWSKLQSGYVPNIQELFNILDNHLKMNQVDKLKFSTP
ncbi:selenoprotein T2-like [Astyanax mexicanus]|uniref:Selenoprotein T n=1 Tax=Astyanax mexicanus TaxID=7994 RepID=A0A8B9K869_ASTMX|nr:selenoprotein T2-like [Astyanax mexicanus]